MAKPVFQVRLKGTAFIGAIGICAICAPALAILGGLLVLMEGVSITALDALPFAQIANLAFALLIWLIALAMAVSSWQYFKLYHTREPVIEFRPEGTFGHNSFGLKRSLQWADVESIQTPGTSGNIVISGPDMRRNLIIRWCFIIFDHWDPDVIVIPVALTPAHRNEILKALFETNPYADRRFPDWRKRLG